MKTQTHLFALVPTSHGMEAIEAPPHINRPDQFKDVLKSRMGLSPLGIRIVGAATAEQAMSAPAFKPLPSFRRTTEERLASVKDMSPALAQKLLTPPKREHRPKARKVRKDKPNPMLLLERAIGAFHFEPSATALDLLGENE